jgi:predicted Rossmann-fold nucleotide-binding protein
VQTRKVTSFPIVCLGTDYWGGLIEWLREAVAGRGNISPADIDLLQLTDDPAEAVRLVSAQTP